MTTILLAMAAVKFSGGTPNDFAAALAEATGQNVVISQGEGKTLPKAEFETTDMNEMARAIRSQIKHVILPGNELVLSDQMLARRLVTGAILRGGSGEAREGLELSYQVLRENEQLSSRPGSTPENSLAISFVGLPPGSVKEGKFTAKTEKANALQIELLNGSFSKPLAAHWIYQEVPVYLQVKDMPEAELLKWIAKAVGARLLNTAKEFKFDLDPVEIRKRALAAIQAEPARLGSRNDAQILEKNKAFRVSVINSLTPAQITEMLATAGSTSRIELSPRSPLTRIALQRVRDLEQYQQGLAADMPGPRTAVGLLRRVDSSRPALLIVDSKFTARMEIPVLDQNGRPAGVVRL
jgi:hypothetical protein